MGDTGYIKSVGTIFSNFRFFFYFTGVQKGPNSYMHEEGNSFRLIFVKFLSHPKCNDRNKTASESFLTQLKWYRICQPFLRFMDPEITQFVLSIFIISGSRNCCISAVSGSRNYTISTISGSRIFLSISTISGSRNCSICGFSIGPPTGARQTSPTIHRAPRNCRNGAVSGSRNHRNTAVSGSRNCKNGQTKFWIQKL